MFMKNDINIPIIKNYAPVIIPTLYRYEHLKNCLESLEKCTHADKTDVIIGLDYPNKETHWEGYNRIDNYLKELELKNKFNNLIVIRRERNYGVGPNGNLPNLIKETLRYYDTYILSEDDNIFSPAFLDYCNKGLEKFIDDKTVTAICGYRYFYEYKFKKNTFFRNHADYSAWGYASWKDRYNDWQKLNSSWFRKFLTIKNFIKLYYKAGNNKVNFWFHICDRPSEEIQNHDHAIRVYIGLTDHCSIMPRFSLVRNKGTEGSGVNFQNFNKELIEKFNNQNVYNNTTYEFIGTGEEKRYYNMWINKKECYEEKTTNFIMTVRYFIRRLIFKKFKKFYCE